MKYYKHKKTQTMEAIGENASRIGETALRIGETTSQIEDNTNAMKALNFSPVQQIGFSVREPIISPDQEGKLFKLSNVMLDIIADMRKQSNSQLRLPPLMYMKTILELIMCVRI